MMQNGLNESFWDGLGVEIGPCANFDPKTFFSGVAKQMAGLILWESIESENIFSVPGFFFFPGSEKMSRSVKIEGICATLNLEV